MTDRKRLVLIAGIAFLAAIAGAFLGRAFIVPPTPVETELHALLHHELDLDSAQQARMDEIERRFAVRKQALELELRADNAQLADAIQAEHGYGSAVSAAVDRSHQAMGQLQKETLEHIFAMRALLKPGQAAKFDAAVVKALTAKEP
ncbi:periplasmic heavy metal sensor [Sphingobium yanoikuyae]|uniref:Periplasmic heavy metal sensor n=1 Tax=Sphingobium yanoikuyae TaxID=13690 RepID=A0AA42X146_SPHYA|nr:periplasmic heavy metal sensor [Sphingobium yanoikuyae]MDH2135145.1 periplasmic heavy metal sensor [Sphingobium yanoikuyae]MDH2151248.1 periplasmic heavy metal sensor [Sphingobium yanoikuyae]MDH2169461.1 periplasmic heavy metal sensor [Sphingobium yanoikuyae]